MFQQFKECCEKCFNSETLKNYIRQNGAKGTCGFCESKNVYCIDPESLQDLFWPVIRLYETLENFMPLDDLKSDEHNETIIDKLNYDWSLFPYYGDEFNQEDIEESLLKAIFPENPHHGPHYQFLHSYVEKEDEYWGIDNRAWEILSEKWKQFCNEIKGHNRFFPQKALDLAIIKKLLSYCRETINKGQILYRARIIHNGKKYPPSKMGKPARSVSESGRANPKGIPYLYVSSSAGTAISEVRPFITDKVTVGDFKLRDILKVVDLRKSTIGDPYRYGDQLSDVVDYLLFIHQLGAELSKAISPRESDIEYIPTQYLSEFIKGLGYDGIVYGSPMVQDESEYNIVVFKDEKLRCVLTTLYKITGISHQFYKRENLKILE